MSFRVSCPNCRTAAAVPDEIRGRSLRCKKCGQPFVAGAPAARKPAPAAPPPKKSNHRVLIATIVAAAFGAGVGFPLVYYLVKKDTPPDAVAGGPTTSTSNDSRPGPDTSHVVQSAPKIKHDSPRDSGRQPTPEPAPVVWQDVTRREWGFSARFPGEVQISPTPAPGQRRHQEFTTAIPITADRKIATFRLACEDHEPRDTSNTDAFLAAQVGDIPLDAKEQNALKWGDFPGIEVRGKLRGGAWPETHRIYLVRARSYHLVVTGPPDKEAQALMAQFFKDFSILDPGPLPPSNPLHDRVLAWVGEVAAPGEPVGDKVKELLATVKDKSGFTIALGGALLKTKKPMLLAVWGGQLFPWELSADHAKALKVGDRDFLIRSFPDSSPRPSEKAPFTLSDLKLNATASEVGGSVAYRRSEAVDGALVLRLTYVMAANLNTTALPIEAKGESGTLTVRGPAVLDRDPQVRAPVVIFVELCAAVGGTAIGRVLSNPVAALLTPPPAPPKDGLATLQLNLPDGWSANFNKFKGVWEITKPPPTNRSVGEEVRIEPCPMDARTPADYAANLKKKDFLFVDVPPFLEVGDKEDLPDGFVFKGVVKKFTDPKTPPILGFVAVRDIGGVKVRCYSVNLRTTKDRPEGAREELLKMFKEASFAPNSH